MVVGGGGGEGRDKQTPLSLPTSEAWLNVGAIG